MFIADYTPGMGAVSGAIASGRIAAAPFFGTGVETRVLHT